MKILSVKPLPSRVDDPANQFLNIKAAKRDINRNYSRLRSGVWEFINRLAQDRVLIANSNRYQYRPATQFEKQQKLDDGLDLFAANARVFMANEYDYRLDPVKLEQIDLFIQRLVYESLLDDPSGRFSERFWFNAHIESAYKDGAEDFLSDIKDVAQTDILSPLMVSAVTAQTAESQLITPSFRNRLQIIYARDFTELKGIADDAKAGLSATLTRAMMDGVGIPEISNRVNKVIQSSANRSYRIARTEIMGAYRQATRDELTDHNELFADTDYEVRLLWFSALAPTTRPWHASRHAKTYTKIEVDKFYSENGNRINCLCIQSPVLVNKKTGEVLQSALVERMKKQKSGWQGAS